MKKFLRKNGLAVGIAIAVLAVLVLYFGGAFKEREVTTFTSTTLTEIMEISNLSTAKYIHNGIAKSMIEGKSGEHYINYKAVVKPNVDFKEIQFDMDDEAKTIRLILPEEFDFEVELFTDSFHYYPSSSDLTIKEVSYICEKDAAEKAKGNSALVQIARENLINTIVALLEPISKANGYTIITD